MCLHLQIFSGQTKFASSCTAARLEVPWVIGVVVPRGFSARATSRLHCLAPLLLDHGVVAALSPRAGCLRRKCFLLVAARKLSAS